MRTEMSGNGLLAGKLTETVIGAAIEVHRHLGPGLLESAYRRCLEWELRDRGLDVKSEVTLPVFYKGREVDCGYRMDLLVEDRVVVELKSVDRLVPLHDAQLLTYLKLADLEIGLLLNFNSPLLRNGIRRLVNERKFSMHAPHCS